MSNEMDDLNHLKDLNHLGEMVGPSGVQAIQELISRTGHEINYAESIFGVLMRASLLIIYKDNKPVRWTLNYNPVNQMFWVTIGSLTMTPNPNPLLAIIDYVHYWFTQEAGNLPTDIYSHTMKDTERVKAGFVPSPSGYQLN